MNDTFEELTAEEVAEFEAWLDTLEEERYYAERSADADAEFYGVA